MTLLEVHEVEPDPGRQSRGRDVPVLETVQRIVVDQGGARSGRGLCGFVDHRPGIEQRVMLHIERIRTGNAVAAGVRQLQADEEVRILSPGGAMGLSTNSNDALEPEGMRFAGQELPRVGPSLGHDGGGLAPDELRPATAPKAALANGAGRRQVVRGAFESTVTPFHRLNHQPISTTLVALLRPLEESPAASEEQASGGRRALVLGHLPQVRRPFCI